MISSIRSYLEAKLRAAGCKAKIYTNYKELEVSRAITLGAVLFEDEKFKRDNTKFRYNGPPKQVRERTYIRTIIMSVVIGGTTEAEVEGIGTKFLGLLDRGISDSNDNYIEINLVKADWVTEKESILASNIAVQYVIEFTGGVFKITNPVNLVLGDITTTPNGGV